MLVAKIYTLVWFLLLTAIGAVYLAGWLGQKALVIFGFLSATLVFLGFIGVIPSLVDHHYSPKQSFNDYRVKSGLTNSKPQIYR